MLRRLLSNSNPIPNGREEVTEEPKEYILLSKMQPLPPPLEQYPQPAMAFHSTLDHHSQFVPPPLNINSTSSFFPLPIYESEFTWPNFLLADPSYHEQPLPPPQVGYQMAPAPSADVQPSPFLPEPDNMALLAPIDAQQQSFRVEKIEAAIGNATSNEQRAKMESPASSEESGISSGQSCQYCNRLFPAPPNRLRRHMAQCRRLKGIQKEIPTPSPLSSLKRHQQTLSPAVAEKKPKHGNGNSPSPQSAHSSATVDPGDPYCCAWCQFKTLYKGNMKRHLICCHQVPAELFQELNFCVERLRKMAPNRPDPCELPIRPRRDDAKGGKMKGTTTKETNTSEEETTNAEDYDDQTEYEEEEEADGYPE